MKFFLVFSIASIVSILASTTAWTIGIKVKSEAPFVVVLPLLLFGVWFFLGRWFLYSDTGKPGCLHTLFAFTLSLTYSAIGPFTLPYIADLVHFDDSAAWGIGLGIFFISLPMLIAAFLSMILMLFLCRPRIV